MNVELCTGARHNNHTARAWPYIRDIKADNVIIQRSASLDTDTFDVKLIDFGFSKVLHNDLTGSYLGTSGYVAP